MPKLIYSYLASLDGYITDDVGKFDWAEPDEEVLEFINETERSVGTYLYGLPDDDRRPTPASLRNPLRAPSSPESGSWPTKSSSRARCRRSLPSEPGSSAASTSRRSERSMGRGSWNGLSPDSIDQNSAQVQARLRRGRRPSSGVVSEAEVDQL